MVTQFGLTKGSTLGVKRASRYLGEVIIGELLGLVRVAHVLGVLFPYRFEDLLSRKFFGVLLVKIDGDLAALGTNGGLRIGSLAVPANDVSEATRKLEALFHLGTAT